MAPIDRNKVSRRSLSETRHLVNQSQFARAPKRGASFADFTAGLPDVYAARDLLLVRDAILSAKKHGRPIVFAMGAHVIKVGLSPVLLALMEAGLITALAMNGAGVIHDVEVALVGETSEDVTAALSDGSFGMAKETSVLISEALAGSWGGAESGSSSGRPQGFGQLVGERLAAADPPFGHLSLLLGAHRLGIPCTVHVAIGSDTIHMHPEADGAAIGRASLADFETLTEVVAELQGGVYLNVGSSVVLPEVFLKALTLARNLGHKVDDFTTANFDFIQHYRPRVNVVRRPTAGEAAKGYAITGHHEILIPLLAQSLIEAAGDSE